MNLDSKKDHDLDEESSDEEKAVLGSHSRINLHETSMVVATTEYLLQQGYASKQTRYDRKTQYCKRTHLRFTPKGPKGIGRRLFKGNVKPVKSP